MKPFRNLFLLVLAALSANLAQGQGYITAAGIRMGPSIGLTVNQRLSRTFTVEGIVHKQFLGDAYLTALGKRHLGFGGRGTNIFFGGGFHTTLDRGDENAFGLDGIVGLEIRLGRINLSADYKPMFTFAHANFENQFGISARYILIENPRRFDRRRQGPGRNGPFHPRGRNNGPFRY